MPGISRSGKIEQALRDAGLVVVRDFATLPDFTAGADGIRDHLATLAGKIRSNSVGKGKLLEWRAVAIAALDEPLPVITNHRLADHPYKSKYGETWQQELDKDVKTRHKSVSVKAMVQHIIDVCTEAYKGSEFEDSWVTHVFAARVCCVTLPRELLRDFAARVCSGFLSRRTIANVRPGVHRMDERKGLLQALVDSAGGLK